MSDDLDLDELRSELDEFSTSKKDQSSKTPREERIIAGFEDIERFFEQHGHAPAHGEDKDIFERLYAVRLDKIRSSAECRAALNALDKHGLLEGEISDHTSDADIDDDMLLEELRDLSSSGSSITELKHVKPRAEINAAEEIANRTPCNDFSKFKPLFDKVTSDIENGIRLTRHIRKEAGFLKSNIKVGDFFILFGQTLYVAEIGEPIKGSNEALDARLRVIYSNGTESNLLLDSLRRGLYKDEASRIVSEPSAGPLFSDIEEEGDIGTGTIYVLRSNSDHQFIKEHRDIIHKIGVTGNNIKKRLGNTKLDPTFLMAEVEIVATYELSNINRTKLENLIHRFFEQARLNIDIKDRFGNPVIPREWFLVPLFVIDDAIEKIKDGTIGECTYDKTSGRIICGSAE